MGQEDEVIDQGTGGAAGQNSEDNLTPTDDSAGAGDAAAAAAAGGEVQPAEPAFVPDFKFRANQQDMEIPEEFRSHVKDVESQKRVKEIFEKYHGFDAQKQKVSTLEGDVNKYRGGYDTLVGNIQQIQQGYAHAVQSGNLHNLDQVFQKLGLGEDVLMAWAGEKARLAGLDPEQQKLILDRNKLEREAYERTQEQNSLMTRNQQQDVQIRQMQFDTAMATPQMQTFATELNAKFGMDGMFEQEVINAGKTAYALEGKVLSVPEAIQAVITKYGLKGQAVAQAAAQAAPIPAQGQPAQGQPAQGGVSADGKKIIPRDTKVIPNVGSTGSASPVGAGKARNLDDVRARYKELAAQG